MVSTPVCSSGHSRPGATGKVDERAGLLKLYGSLRTGKGVGHTHSQGSFLKRLQLSVPSREYSADPRAQLGQLVNALEFTACLLANLSIMLKLRIPLQGRAVLQDRCNLVAWRVQQPSHKPANQLDSSRRGIALSTAVVTFSTATARLLFFCFCGLLFFSLRMVGPRHAMAGRLLVRSRSWVLHNAPSRRSQCRCPISGGPTLYSTQYLTRVQKANAGRSGP